MLEINNLSKKYGGRYALKDVNLNLGDSSIIGIVGPNGAGKTTLLKCVTNLVSNYSGLITTPSNSTVGLVLDDLKAYQSRTLKFNLNYFKLAKGLDDYSHSLSILKDLNFDLSLLNNRLRTFSYGMNQKVITSLSLMSNPDIVLLDEPFRGLDFDSIEAFKGLLYKLKEQEKLVLFSSHNIADVEEICDKVIVINKGVILDIIDAKVIGDSRYITFNTSNNEAALELIKEYNPTIVKDKIELTLENNQWNEILKLLVNNNIEVLNTSNNSTLLSRVRALFKGGENK